MTLRLSMIRSAEEFGQLRDVWHELWERSSGSIFQHHGWLFGWLNGVMERRTIRPMVALVWDDATLVAAMPLAIHRRRGVRVLHWAGQLFSDYCDVLIEPGCRREMLLKMMWRAVTDAGGFDLVNLHQVRPDAVCRQLFDDPAPGPAPLKQAERRERCLRIDNHWKSGADFFRSLNKKARNNHTRGKRILAEMIGAPEMRIVDENEDLAPYFSEIWRLKEAWLKATHPSSPFLGEDSSVLQSILQSAWPTGLVKVFLLECGGTIVSGSINFVYGNRVEAYLTAYDPRFDRASPGTILIVDYAQWAFDRGLTHVDFLRGDEAFKFRMANAETVLNGYQGARTLIGHIATSGHRLLSRRWTGVETASEPQAGELEPV